MEIKAPHYIPAPRPNDKEYTELCKRLFDLENKNEALYRKNILYLNLFTVAAMLLFFLSFVCLMVFCLQHIEIIFK